MSTAIQIFENPADKAPSDAEQLGAEITELCSYIYAAEYRLLTLIRTFDEKEYWAQQGLCSCAHWLNFKCGISMGAAREKVRVAHALAVLPKISEGFANGKLSYSKVRAITRIADETNEDYLLMIAEQGALIVKALEMAMDANFADVPAGTSRRIACDSSIVTIKEDKNGEPLSIARRSRTIPPPMRRALRVRDKGCRFPGCTNTRFVDGHHIEHWADGGETSLDNLIMLCRHHHHLVHEGGFVCEKSPTGEINFKDQRAQTLDSFPTMPGVAANDAVQQWIDREFFEANIDSETCAARWHAGERMDWHAAVGSLF